MSGGSKFTDREEREFREWDFQRRRKGQLEWYRHGVPMTSRQEEWLQDQERQKEQQAAWEAKHPQSFANAYPTKTYAEPDYEGQNASPGPSRGAPPASAYTEPVDSEPAGSESGSVNNKIVAPPNDGPRLQSRRNMMIKHGDHLHEIRVHSRRNGWKGLVATLDTGTEENWICRKVVERLNLHIIGGRTVKCVTFDGRKFSSGEIVSPTWVVEGQSKSHVTVFRVAPKDAPFDVLFGRNLLSDEEVDFDSEESPIQVGVQPTEKPDEKKVRDQRQAEFDKQRQKYASTPQPVKKEKSDKKSTERSSTIDTSSRDTNETIHKK